MHPYSPRVSYASLTVTRSGDDATLGEKIVDRGQEQRSLRSREYDNSSPHAMLRQKTTSVC